MSRTHPAVTEDDLQRMLQNQLDALIVKCEAFGYVIDLDHEPLLPLRMRAFRMIGSVRPLSKPPHS
jgi:hypothetical protein